MRINLVLNVFVSAILVLSGGCSLFGGGMGSSDEAPIISAPPKKVGSNDLTTVVNVTPAELNSQNHRAVKKVATSSSVEIKQPRIEEERGAGGNVTEIKVNNAGDVPDYYIYPSQQQQDSVVNNRPDMNVSTPNWQINW